MDVEKEILDLKRMVYGNDSGESDYAPDPVTVASGQWTGLISVTLTKGRYLVIYGAAFATNATGYRQLHFAVNSTTAGRFSPSVQAVTGEQTRLNATITTEITTDTATLTLWARQNSGVDLATYGYVRVIKI